MIFLKCDSIDNFTNFFIATEWFICLVVRFSSGEACEFLILYYIILFILFIPHLQYPNCKLNFVNLILKVFPLQLSWDFDHVNLILEIIVLVLNQTESYHNKRLPKPICFIFSITEFNQIIDLVYRFRIPNCNGLL